MPNCSFCGEKMMRGTGKMYVYKDGRIAFICSSKCQKNLLKLRRNPSQTTWTKKHQDVKQGGKK